MPATGAQQASSAARRRAGFLAGCLLMTGCTAFRDRVARQDVESLESNMQHIESTLQSRQTGINEQLRELREEQARIEGLIEENRRASKNVGQRVDLLRDKTHEDFDRRDRIQQESAKALGEQDTRLGEKITSLQAGLQTLNDNLLAISAFEKKQEERITKIQENFQGQLKVVVDEVGQENRNLENAINALRGDLQTTQAGLGELHKSMQQIADALADAQRELQELARKQETLRRSAAASSPQNSHIVKAGETLTGISVRFGVSVQALMEKNQITDPNELREGQKLIIPGY